MRERVLNRFPQHYILVMMCVNRAFAVVVSSLCIVYVNLTFNLAMHTKRNFELTAVAVIVVGVILTTLLACWETRDLRRVLVALKKGKPVELGQAVAAGRQAVLFPGRHAIYEALLDPVITIVPLSLVLHFLDHAPPLVTLQVALAGSMGLTALIMVGFFVTEHWLRPVIRHLLEEGIPIAYTQLPQSKLHLRMTICFSLAIAVTGLLIGALANQRAMEIIRFPEQQAEAVVSLREHTVLIMLFAIGMGLFLARLLSNSISSRVQLMLEAMRHVEQGHLSERLRPTGNDELDILARQFDMMVEQLDQNDQTIRDLNASLEKKVRRRTRQLSRSRRSLKRSLTKLTEHDRMKTEFFSNVSHELRTPLTMIIAPVDRVLTQQGDAMAPETVKMLEMVRLNGHRLLDLINRLLDFSKLEAGQMKLQVGAIDLNALVQKLASAATPLCEQRGITLEVDCDPELPVFGADEHKVDTIVSNLISNAVKFTPAEGRIRVETHAAVDRVWVSISDSGIGIEASQCDRIFERFVQVDGSSSREFSGTGLGLSLVKGLVELHGGGIHVKSEPGQGSRFWFDLPLREAPQTSSASDSAERRAIAKPFADLATYDQPPATGQETAEANPYAPCVLVVDDTADMRMLVGEILGDRYRVLYARDGQEGLEVAHRSHPDLIISDVMMPRVDGHEFCRRMKQDPTTAHIPFVMLTAKADLEMKIDGLDQGADEYLTKPFDEKELHARVRSLLRLRGMHQDLDRRNRELHTAYSDLQSLQNQLVQAEKMSSLGQLISGLAHEINNSINAVYNGIKPLSASVGRLEAMLAEVLASPEMQSQPEIAREVNLLFKKIFSLAKVIETGATRTARIIGDLKTFSHPGNEGFQVFDLHESLDMCLNLLGNSLRDRVEVIRDYGPIGRIYGPSGQLNQVFMNILSNAQQAMEEEGEIKISTRQEGDAVLVSIRDNGPGISPEHLDRLFDPFFTTKEPGEGTGLGLSLSYGLMTKMGGSIECKSTLGEGAEFIVRFPCVAEAPQRPNADSDSNLMAASEAF